MTRVAPICLFLLLLATSLAETKKIIFLRLGLNIVQERVGLVPEQDEDRAQRLSQLFTNAGCPMNQQQIQKTDSDLPNVICTIRGTGPDSIVIGAHYDHHGGSGAVDNWSGAAMLPILAESIGSVAMKHTLIFVAFGGKYHGASGSRVFMKELGPERKNHIAAMINLDSIGLAPPKYWPDDTLVQPLQLAALNSHVPQPKARQVDHLGLADTDVFRKAKIASITIHSLGHEGSDVLYVIDSHDDTAKALDMRAYYETYEMLSVYLAYLDQFNHLFHPGKDYLSEHEQMQQSGSHGLRHSQ